MGYLPRYVALQNPKRKRKGVEAVNEVRSILLTLHLMLCSSETAAQITCLYGTNKEH
jgi:hypothetical protein